MSYDATIIGSGPNGLAAAIRLAQEGLAVLVLEGQDTVGGGTRSGELTLPGFKHDICSAIHPLGLASPFLRNLPLEQFGLDWIQPDAPFGQAISPDESVVIERDLNNAVDALGAADGKNWQRLFRPYVDHWQALMDDFLGPLPIPPKHPVLMARFGLASLGSATGLARRTFRSERARAAFGGMAAHSMMPLEWPAVAGFGMMLGILAHAVGWPMARGGSQAIADAMTGYFKSLGGEIKTGMMIDSYDQLPQSRAVLFDTSPRAVLSIAGSRLARGYARQLEAFRYGAGVCKVDWAVSEPIPWQSSDLKRTATVHISGTLDETALGERAVWEGRVVDKPYVLLVQPSLFDGGRAPEGGHTVWAYIHVPHGSTEDYSPIIESQIERFAPGFRETILAKKVQTAVQMEIYNPNYVGGDINGGVQNLRQFYTRPAVQWNPYKVPGDFGNSRAYLCSSSTPPGGGVHGMCGYYSAQAVLRDL